MILKDCYKGSGLFCDKVCHPEETIKRVRARLEAADLHILQDTVRIDSGRLGIPVYISKYHPVATRLIGKYKQMGKGVTQEQAEASAIMELVERYTIFDFLYNRDRLSFPLPFSDSTDYIPVSDILKTLYPRNIEPDLEKNLIAVMEHLPLEWVETVSPADGKTVFAPFSWFWPINEYNGSASGNSFEEAAVQAVSEVIERHVCSLVTYDRLLTPEIDQESVQDPVSVGLLNKFRENGINLVLKDFSLDTEIPTVAAIAWDPVTYPERSEIVYTAGTAPEPERALIRALTEIAQLAGDFDTDGQYAESGLPKFETLDEASYVLESSDLVAISEMPDCGTDNFRTELEKMCRKVEKSGLKVYLADVSHPELQLPVVYAMVAGNHFRDRTVNLNIPFHCARIAGMSRDRFYAEKSLSVMDGLYRERYEIAFYMAYLFEENGDFGLAIDWYREALDRNPDKKELASIYCHVGVCLKELGRFDEAVEEFAKAKAVNPSLKEIHNQLGYCYYRKGEFLKAVKCFEEAVAIDPGSAIDYANIASNLRKLGLNSEAIKFYDIALELDPYLDWAQDQRKEVASFLEA